METKKKINVLNEFVAVLLPKAETGLVGVDDRTANYNNEGTLIGVGPGAAEFDNVLGWKVIFRNSRHIPLEPDSGDYAGHTVLIMPKTDLVVRLGTAKNLEIE